MYFGGLKLHLFIRSLRFLWEVSANSLVFNMPLTYCEQLQNSSVIQYQ